MKIVEYTGFITVLLWISYLASQESASQSSLMIMQVLSIISLIVFLASPLIEKIVEKK